MRTRVGGAHPPLRSGSLSNTLRRKAGRGSAVEILHATCSDFLIIFTWHTLPFLFLGVTMGLCLGILPGIGGVAGTALLLPFTYAMDAPTAMALLLGLGATTTTADPISAIVLGAPRPAASAPTTPDGYPITPRGAAGRAPAPPSIAG